MSALQGTGKGQHQLLGAVFILSNDDRREGSLTKECLDEAIHLADEKSVLVRELGVSSSDEGSELLQVHSRIRLRLSLLLLFDLGSLLFGELRGGL